ncbi:transposase [Nitrosomonas halophila]|uniref:transposase n=1 Tax=Nitrosomonas halophila TaxID=44576 RepID=UPI0015A4CC98
MLPVRIFVTQGTTADCTQAGRLIEEINADYLLADRGYDSNAIIEQAKKQKMKVDIPPKRNRKLPRPYDKEQYKRDDSGRRRATSPPGVCRPVRESWRSHLRRA